MLVEKFKNKILHDKNINRSDKSYGIKAMIMRSDSVFV